MGRHNYLTFRHDQPASVIVYGIAVTINLQKIHGCKDGRNAWGKLHKFPLDIANSIPIIVNMPVT